ncbi:MAG: glycosyltransferase family 10 [Planctomycetaceae bacterium]
MASQSNSPATPIHVFYGEQSAPLFRRMAGDFPLILPHAVIDEDCADESGWLVVCEPNVTAFTTRIPRSRRAICINEPSAMNDLPSGYVNQFGLLISPYRMHGYRGAWFQTHTGLPWFFGASLLSGRLTPTLSLRDLHDLAPPEKSNSVSVVVSRKVFHSGHRRRLRLLELLKEKLGDRLQIYGRGIREIQDKAEAIMPSALHLALENTIEPSYWTEKLSDAFLGYSLPVYSGCPDIHNWFAADSMLTVNPDDPEATCATIVTALDQQLYEQRLPAICKARQKVLTQETAFHVISRAIRAQESQEPILKRAAMIQPPNRGQLVDRVRREVRRVYYQLTFRSHLRK